MLAHNLIAKPGTVTHPLLLVPLKTSRFPLRLSNILNKVAFAWVATQCFFFWRSYLQISFQTWNPFENLKTYLQAICEQGGKKKNNVINMHHSQCILDLVLLGWEGHCLTKKETESWSWQMSQPHIGSHTLSSVCRGEFFSPSLKTKTNPVFLPLFLYHSLPY